MSILKQHPFLIGFLVVAIAVGCYLCASLDDGLGVFMVVHMVEYTLFWGVAIPVLFMMPVWYLLWRQSRRSKLS